MADLVVLKDLNTRGMTRSAKDTVVNPGRNVQQKAGLDRGIVYCTLPVPAHLESRMRCSGGWLCSESGAPALRRAGGRFAWCRCLSAAGGGDGLRRRGLAGLLVVMSLAAVDVGAQTAPLFRVIEDGVAVGSRVAVESAGEVTAGIPAWRGETVRGRWVRTDFGLLDVERTDALERGAAALELNLFDDVVFRVVEVRTARTSSGGVSLSGGLEGVRFGSAALVVNAETVAGSVRTPRATYEIGTLGGAQYVREVDTSGREECGVLPPADRPTGVPPPAPEAGLSPRLGGAGGQRVASGGREAGEDASGGSAAADSAIDVLVVYTPAVRELRGGAEAVRALVDLWESETNRAYADSGVEQRIFVVRVSEVFYQERRDHGSHIRRLSGRDDGFMDVVHAWRRESGADLVHLIADVGYPCGTANPGGAFGVTDHACGAGTFAHELGHNMGLHHDYYAVHGQAEHPGGHGYVNQAQFATGASPAARWRTIMAYNEQCKDKGLECPKLMRFSNADQLYLDDPLGALEGSPGGPADAQHALDLSRARVAGASPPSRRPTMEVTGTRSGRSLDMSGVVRNASRFALAATTATLRRSRDTNFDAGDVAVASFAVPALGSRESHDVATATTVPEAFGVYRYGLCVDAVAGDDPGLVCSPAIEVVVLNDYDTDDDGLIEIASLAQLDAVRHDLDGDGVPAESGKAAHSAVFSRAMDNMGCPSAGCAGYELTTDLDLDTNGSGAADAGDAYWNDGVGWSPIGADRGRFDTTFDGNGHAIANLYARGTTGVAGLFGYTGRAAVVRNVGLVDVAIHDGGGTTLKAALVADNRGKVRGCYALGAVSAQRAGGLVGWNEGAVAASYAAVRVRGAVFAGGLVYWNADVGTITASYATGAVSGDEGGGAYSVGGLAAVNSGVVTASFATGRVSGGDRAAGLANREGAGRIGASYFDADTSGVSGAAGRRTAALHAPTGYTGIYADWNVDFDGDGDADDPWDFGTGSQYPALSVDTDADGDATWEEFGHQRPGSVRLPAATPTATIAAGTTPVTEGTAVTFTVHLDAAATAALAVALGVTETGAALSGTPPAAVAFAVGETSRTVTVATADDDLIEGASTVTAALSSGTGYRVGAASSAAVEVTDDDTATFVVTALPTEIAEGDSATLTVVVANGKRFAVEQTIALVASGTASPSDYTVSSTSVALAAGAVSTAATVSAVDDDEEEAAETVVVAVRHGGARVGTVTVTVEASDAPSDDATLSDLVLSGVDIGTFSGEVTDYTADVDNGVDQTTVTATPNDAAAAVRIGGVSGTVRTVRLAVGANTVEVEVTAADGTTTRTYTVAVTRAATPVATIAARTSPVTEGTAVTFTVHLDTAATTALAVALGVTETGAALSGTPPAAVAFAVGETSRTATVATADDDLIEGASTVTATLSVGEGYTLGATTSADVTVTDDDTPSWTVTASPSLIEEGGGATLTVSTGNGTTFPAEVAITLGVSGTVSEADYALSASSLTLSARSESATVTLSASADDEMEDAETATVTASVDGTAAGSTTVTVEDAAPAPTIAGVPQVGGVLEAVPSGAVGYQWLRAGEPIAGAVAARYAPLDADVDAVLSVRVNARGRWRTSASTMPIWTAPVSPPLAAGEEELLGTTMTLGLGASRYKLAGFLRRGDWESWPEDFGSVDDAAFADGRRELRAFLVNRPGRFALVTAPDIGDATDVTAYWNEHALGPLEKRAAGGVTTWEAPELPNGGRYFGTVPEASEGVRVAVSLRRPLPEATLTASSETVTEGASATFSVDLDRAAWSALGVAVAVTETGTMLSGSVPATVTFAAGESTATLTLATDDDAVVEGDGSLTVALVPGDGYVLGTAATAVTAVTDDDAAEFSVSASPAAIDEGAGSTLTVSIANGVTFAETQAIDLAVSGTAVPDDYRLSATGLVLGAGTSSVSATLTALRDVWAEAAETVTLTASRAGSTVGSATVTIAANEAVVSTVTVSAVATPVTEGAAAQFELRLDAAALAALTVAVSASETGSVLSGTPPSTVAFAVGESSRVLSLATVDDTVVEADSAVTLTLGTGSGYTPDTAASAVVTVEDNDIATFDVSASSEEIDEGEETTLTVSIGNGVTFAADQTITLSVSGTAALADYLLSATSLALGAGASSVAATLTVVDDTDEEPAETLTVTATRDGSTVGSVTVTIRVSDVPSDDASLAALTLSGVDIGLFAPDVTDYTAAVETEVASTTVSATVNDAGAAVAVADGTGSTAGDTRTVSLAEGDNAITVTVTAEDGTTTRTYRVTVTRAFARTWGERLSERDIALGPSAFPSGLWSDGSTLWVIENWSRGQVRAYALADGSRLSERDIRLRGGSGFPSGLWSDGTTLWVADHNGGVTAYLLSDGSRRPAEDLDGTVLESAGNLSPTGLWSNGSTLWVADHAAAKVFAYRLSDKTRLVGREFALVDGNGTPMAPFGVWSDGELLLASNYLLGGVLGYGLADGGLRASRSLATSASGTSNPMGLWSDGRVLWVVDDLARRVYAYAVPGLSRTGVSGVFPIRPSNRAFGVPAAAAGAAVWIPDGGLRSRIAAALGKLASAPIGERELAALEWLDARGAGVADLAGLQYAVNLTAVDLGANAIADLRVLAELPSLRVLNLDGTTADVWPLARLTGLRRLSLRGGGLTDVQALGGMTALRVLDIGDNHLEDLAPLGGLSNLEALRADGTAVEDTSALDALERLHILDLGGGRPERRPR